MLMIQLINSDEEFFISFPSFSINSRQKKLLKKFFLIIQGKDKKYNGFIYAWIA